MVCEGCTLDTFPDPINGGCVTCPRHSMRLNVSGDGVTDANQACKCLEGYFHSYNSKAYGGAMTYATDEGGRTYRVHTYADGKGLFIVMKAVMMEVTCTAADGVGREVILRDWYEPDRYRIDVQDTACILPFRISYEVDGPPDAGETETFFQCRQCKPGFYSDVQGVDQCNWCLPGTYQNSTGTTACRQCQPGNISSAGMASCYPCPEDTYQVSNECRTCPAGKYSYGGATACLSCPENTWKDPDMPRGPGCQLCPPWSTSAGGSGAAGCRCAEGLYMYASPWQVVCAQCPRGKYSSGSSNECAPCPVGTYSDTMATSSCTSCATREAAPGGATACTQCVSPYVPNGNRSACQLCPGGYVCLPSGMILLCPKGSYGGAKGLTSMEQCVPCPIGYACPDPDTVEPCPPNTYSLPGASNLKECMCRDGFDCTYTKSVKGKLVLPISVSEFTAAMQQELIKAIAESAGMFSYRCADVF
jgi:hypothetical protein